MLEVGGGVNIHRFGLRAGDAAADATLDMSNRRAVRATLVAFKLQGA
jgi:hypothetical protein